MKRAWRFIKWFASKCTWFDLALFGAAFTFSSGLTAGPGADRDMFWIASLCFVVGALIVFLYNGIKTMWKSFIEEDEKIFDILKQKDIK